MVRAEEEYARDDFFEKRFQAAVLFPEEGPEIRIAGGLVEEIADLADVELAPLLENGADEVDESVGVQL